MSFASKQMLNSARKDYYSRKASMPGARRGRIVNGELRLELPKPNFAIVGDKSSAATLNSKNLSETREKISDIDLYERRRRFLPTFVEPTNGRKPNPRGNLKS